MFYKMIEAKRNEWLASETCTVKAVIDYIVKTGQMRDAQVEAIKTYLFLKIACSCKPLAELFCEGAFNTLDLDDSEVSHSTREYLKVNKAAAALFEYACLTNDAGEQVSPKLEQQIRKAPESIDYGKFFLDAFYDLSYTDYLFSLPMGAGKTYLMAAFIYLDLYFARNEPKNSAFAHNFIIFAPSGLKSSVVPSLKTIQNFDPTWVIPEPAASELKRTISFEVLDQSKTAKKSNKTKNPNVQKIANHQPLSELFGLVAVTNAEKVILDRIQESQGQINLFEESDDEKDRQANELRNLIGKLPALSIFIDEVHHAVSDEIKLRAVVTHWAENDTVNSVIGFSGTPYLEKAEKITVVDNLSVATAEITNIVYYYPLINGVGNFLKRPVVKIAELADSSRIIEAGVREFFETYKDIDVIRAPNKKRHFELGSDITITANNHHFNVNYKFQGTLQEQIREMKLISAMMQKQPIYIGKVLMPVFSSLDFHGHTLDEVSNRLSALLRADATLKKLHVQKDLSLGSLTDKETSNLNYLVDGILDGSTVPLKCSEQPAVGKISIGNITLLLVLKKADNKTGCFIRNFFEIDDLVLTGKDASPEHGTRVSPYVLMTAEQLETIDNVDLSEIVPSIQKQPYSTIYGEHIVLLILELLKLYDRRKDTTILDVVIQLLDFLSEKDFSQVDLYQINRLQTEKRRRKLNPEEIQYLSSMKSKGIPAQYQLAANILLESFYEAQLIYDQLCPEEKEVFASYPIMNLWKSKG